MTSTWKTKIDRIKKEETASHCKAIQSILKFEKSANLGEVALALRPPDYGFHFFRIFIFAKNEHQK